VLLHPGPGLDGSVFFREALSLTDGSASSQSTAGRAAVSA